jgi:tetratricopeptide (TPR) repeat protein
MMLIAALCLLLSASAGQEPDARTQAERLARSGAHEEALKRFQALAAMNPDDVAARLWIGRLHQLMGHPRRAAAVFESLVAIDSRNVDAMTGLGLALIETSDWRAAADALNRAEALAADRVDVLTAQGRLHAADGRPTLALAYYGRALAAEPGNAAIRAEADALRASRAHRVTLGYDFQAFDPSIGALHAGRVEVNARVSDAVRVFARGQLLRHEGDDESRGGGGIEWMPGPAVRLRGGVQFGSSTRWLPERDAFVGGRFGRGRTQWTVRAHFVDFDGADMWIAGPGVIVDLTPRTTLVAEYLRGSTNIAGGTSEITDNGSIGLHAKLSPHTSAFVEYHRGIDRLDWFTLDRIGAADANTLSIGGRGDLTPFVGLGARYDYQERRGDLRIHRVAANFTFRF